jgi:hypothetical protein
MMRDDEDGDMMDLFIDIEKLHAYRGKQRTSAAAADIVLPITGKTRIAVYEFTEDCGPWGATLEEMEGGTGLSANTVRPRRKELEELGFIVDSGHTRKNKNDRDCIIWLAASVYARSEARISTGEKHGT